MSTDHFSLGFDFVLRKDSELCVLCIEFIQHHLGRNEILIEFGYMTIRQFIKI